AAHSTPGEASVNQQIDKSTCTGTEPGRPSHGLEVGVMLNNLERDRLGAFAVAAKLGFHPVHTGSLPEQWLRGPERAAYVAAARASGLVIDTMFVGFDGQSYADLPTIVRTVGLTNPATRAHRLQVALAYVDLATEVGAPSLSAHIGILTERGPDYANLVKAVQEIADRCAQQRLTFHLETGQESAEVLLRFLHQVDRPHLGVNFDAANFILYGTDEPLSALDHLAPWVRGVHCKD